MCRGFGIIVTKDGRYLFCEPDMDGDCSHSEILRRAGIIENENQFLRNFVRVEYPDWKEESFRFEENLSLPAWVGVDETTAKCSKLLIRVATALDEYEKVRATALDEYEKVRDPGLG